MSKFEEWHESQLAEDYKAGRNGYRCPHEEWERAAWNAALEEAARVVQGPLGPVSELGEQALIEAILALKDE